MKVTTRGTADAAAIDGLAEQKLITADQASVLHRNEQYLEHLPHGAKAELLDALSSSPAFTRAEAEAAVRKLERLLKGESLQQISADALRAAAGEETLSFPISKPMTLTDGARTPTRVKLTVPAGRDALESVTLSLNISHPRPKDALEVKLIAPSGKTITLTPDHLATLGRGEAKLSLAGLKGEPSSGVWTVEVRDKDVKRDAGKLNAASLTLVTGGKPTYVSPPAYEQLTSAQRTKYAAVHDKFMTPAHLQHHAGWHERNGPGGTRGTGSGEEFLLFHHQMMIDFGKFLAANGAADLVPPATWNPLQKIPPEIKNAKATRQSDGPLDPPAPPSWLKLKKDQGAGEGVKAAPGDIAGIKSLDDVKTADDLGRVLGTSGYHASGHVKIGGTMAAFQSPQDPIFFGWHGHMEDIFQKWLNFTETGRTWAKDNADKLADHGGHAHMGGAQSRGPGQTEAPPPLSAAQLARRMDFNDTRARRELGLTPLRHAQ